MYGSIGRSVHTIFTVSLALAVAANASAQQMPPALRDLDAYIERAMAQWNVAGAAIAVVKDDSVVLLRGFGTREVGKPARVTRNTVFAIGSNTKLFTAVASGMLVDDGRLQWDEPVTTYLPTFRLLDPWVTYEVTIRDL